MQKIEPSEYAALQLFNRFLAIEKSFGRIRDSSSVKWGPRSLDIDFLAWGELQINHKDLMLPHPRLFERSFVIVPLAEALTRMQNSPRKIPASSDWPE